MAVNTCEMWSIGIKIAFFPKKITKSRPAPGGFAPRLPFVFRLSYTALLNKYPNLDVFTLLLLV